MKLLLVCLDGVRVDLALPEAIAVDARFAAPDHPSDPRFAAVPVGDAPDRTVPLEQARSFGVLAPTLARLVRAGERSDGCLLPLWMTPPTDSGPGWSSVLTGSTHEECNVWWNEFVGHQLARRPDILTRLWAARPCARTLVAASWEALTSASGPGPVFQQRVDQQRTGQHKVIECLSPDLVAADAEVTTRAGWVLNHEGPDAAVVYLQGSDDAGHRYGADSPAYRQAISAVDEHLRHLVKAVAERHEVLGEDWLVAVVTDHGHKPEGGHGEDEVEVRRSFLALHRMGGRLPAWAREHATLRAEQVCGLLMRLVGASDGTWEASHDVGVLRDVAPAGPTRDLDFEW